jgi:hypothetical protein
MPNKYFDKKIKRIELPSKESSKSYKIVVEKEKILKEKKRKKKKIRGLMSKTASLFSL